MADWENFKNDLKTRLNVSTVVGRKVKLTRKGNHYLGLCPFHNEKTPSFNVVDDKEFYHCFGCKEHGDIFSFVMKTEGVTFIEAMKILSAEAGMEMPAQSAESKQQTETRNILYDVCEHACQYFQKQLVSDIGADALSYVKSRQISQEMIMEFRMGYAPNGMDLINSLRKAGFDDKHIIEAGLANRGDNGMYAFFRDRLMFAISDIRGRVIAFGGRFMGDAKEKGVGKYINSPETPLFDKSRTLYNLKNARSESYKSKQLIVAEGYMDVVSLTQGGFPSAIAPLGTALTENHIMESWKSVDVPILCFDGDEAGQKAAERSCERIVPILSAGKSVKIAFMPNGLDPDDVIKSQGSDAMQSILDNAITLIDYLWQCGNEKIKVNTPESLSQLEKYFNDIAFSIKDKSISSNYRSAFNNLIWENHKKRKPNKGNNAQKSTYTKPLGANVMNNVSLPLTHQKIVLAGLINHPSLFYDLEERIVNFFSDNFANLFNNICNLLANNELSSEDLITQLQSKGFDNELGQILNNSTYIMAKDVKSGGDKNKAKEMLIHTIDVVNARAEEQAHKQNIKQALLDGQDDVSKLEDQAKLSTRAIYIDKDE